MHLCVLQCLTEAGKEKWSQSLPEYRATPVLGDGMVYMLSNATDTLLAFNKTTGVLIWKTQLTTAMQSDLTLIPA